MWAKVLGKVIDICLVSGLASLSAMCVVKAACEIKDTIKGVKANGSDPK